MFTKKGKDFYNNKFNPHDFDLLKSIMGDSMYNQCDYLTAYNTEKRLGTEGYQNGFISHYELLCYLEILQERALIFTSLSVYYEKCLELDFNGNK
jgi:hypothetical protein